MSRDVSVLLVEDNKEEIEVFKEYFYIRDGVKLVAIANSSDEALEVVKSHCPDGVILDIELNKGKGSGYMFLKGIKELKMDNKPVIVVTTKLDSNIANARIHSYGVPIIISKNKPDYSPEFVTDNLIELVDAVRELKDNSNTLDSIDTEEMKKTRIEKRILYELEEIGILDNYRGKKYLIEAIYYLIEHDLSEMECPAVKYLEVKYSIPHGTMSGLMQTAINRAWRKCTIEKLERQYKAVVYHETGVPTVNEFIYYYATKIYEQFK